MPRLDPEHIRKRFETSKHFDELFDAFSQALEQHLSEPELYRRLFWNPALRPEELCFFAEKTVKEFPAFAYDVYMLLAGIFEATYGHQDNFELAFQYYRKAASAQPLSPDPYLEAADCYDPDLRIPSLAALIAFLREGVGAVRAPELLYGKLAELFDLAGNDEMGKFYRSKAGNSDPPTETGPAGV